MSRASNPSTPPEDVSYQCPCGKTHNVNGIQRWARYILDCGAPVIALRPIRTGPLKLFPSKPDLSREEYFQKYGTHG